MKKFSPTSQGTIFVVVFFIPFYSFTVSSILHQFVACVCPGADCPRGVGLAHRWYPVRSKFHQHFTCVFLIQKCFVKLFVQLRFGGKSTLVQNCECKMLMKLTSVANFINILRVQKMLSSRNFLLLGGENHPCSQCHQHFRGRSFCQYSFAKKNTKPNCTLKKLHKTLLYKKICS